MDVPRHDFLDTSYVAKQKGFQKTKFTTQKAYSRTGKAGKGSSCQWVGTSEGDKSSENRLWWQQHSSVLYRMPMNSICSCDYSGHHATRISLCNVYVAMLHICYQNKKRPAILCHLQHAPEVYIVAFHPHSALTHSSHVK